MPATDTPIIVFARAPEPGQAKTRLIPLLGAHGAAALQEKMIERTLATARAAACGPVELWCDPSAHHPWLAQCMQKHGIGGATQCEGDLGARMLHAATTALATATRVVIIGTDCPALTAADVRAATDALETHDCVLIPAEDGGYVLIALKWWDARLFSDMPWGGEQVLAKTRERLTALEWRWHEMPALWDIDRPADVARLEASGLMPEWSAHGLLPRF